MKSFVKDNLCYLILSVIPLAVVWSFYHIYSQASLFDVIPYTHYDPFDYLMQINGFAKYGFGMGHFSQNEVVPFVSSSPYGCHGPFYVSLVGIVVKMFGGMPYTAAAVLNFLFLTASILLFFFLVRPRLATAVYCTVLLVSYPEFIHYTATFWQEAVNMGSALILAGLYFKVLSSDRRSAHSYALFFFLVLFSLFRPSWTLFFPGYFAAVLSKGKWRTWLSLVAGAVCMLGTFFLYQYFASPSVGHYAPWQLILIDLHDNTIGLFEAIHKMAILQMINIWHIVLAVWSNKFLFCVYVFSFGSVAYSFCKSIWGVSEKSKEFYYKLAWILLCNALILCATSLTQFLQPRHVYPGFLFCCLLLASLELFPAVRGLLLGAQVTASLFSFQLMQNYGYDLTHNIEGRRDDIEWFKGFSEAYIKYTPTSNAWCNSILVDDFTTMEEFLGLPDGIGVSYILAPTLYSNVVKSRYVFIKSDENKEKLLQHNKLQHIAGSTIGDLYVNLDCDCPSNFKFTTPGKEQAEALEKAAVATPVTSDGKITTRMVLSTPLVVDNTTTATRVSPAETVVLVRASLDVRKFFDAQVDKRHLTKEESDALSKLYADLSVEFVFTSTQGKLTIAAKSLHVHCLTGRILNIALTDDDVFSLVDNRPISSVAWHHKSSVLPICSIP